MHENNQGDIKSEFVSQTSDKMKSRYRYTFSISDIIYNYLNVFNWLNFWCKRILKGIYHRQKLFEKGEDKFIREFDAVDFVQNQK